MTILKSIGKAVLRALGKPTPRTLPLLPPEADPLGYAITTTAWTGPRASVMGTYKFLALIQRGIEVQERRIEESRNAHRNK